MVSMNPSYTYTREGVYYYSRVVPKDLRVHYIKDKIVMSLRTTSDENASMAATLITSKLESYWLSLRLVAMDIPAAHLLVSNTENDTKILTLSQAKTEYINLKGDGRSKTFFTSAERNTNYAISCLGDRPLDGYSTTDGGKFRDWLKGKSLSNSSIRRILTTVKSIVALAISEHGLGITNGFSGLYINDDNERVAKRLPFSLSEVKSIQSKCCSYNDELRWLIALISDTGMRLSEAVGLHLTDLHIEESVPYVSIKPHDWRSLKTSSSNRMLPLVGASLWAAKQIMANADSEFCFSRYCNRGGCNSNSASAALNKWLKKLAGKEATVHGFRHSMRDRLRAIQCPTEIIDACGGWASGNVGSQYGTGYPLSILQKWMSDM
jgi:integrase